MFSGEGTEEVLNDGKLIRTKIKIVCESGQGIDIWAYNYSGGALTPGTIVSVIGKLYVKSI